MSTNSNSVSIVANLKISVIVESLKEIASLVVFERNSNTSMDAAAKTLIHNVTKKHLKTQFESASKSFTEVQKLIIRGEGAEYKMGPDPKPEQATDEDVANGLAATNQDLIPSNPDGILRIGSLNYDVWERDTYRKKLYFSIYGSLAPELPSIEEVDPYNVPPNPANNEKLYTENEKVDFEKWFVSKLSSPIETLEPIVFETITDSIEIDSFLKDFKLLVQQIPKYKDKLKEFKPLILKLDRLEAELKVINDQIKELESI